MPDPVVPSPRPHRLRPPAPTAFDIERPRLTTAIHQGAERGIVVLSAPVGFGATTAVAQAIRTMGAVAWVSLDGLDADPMSLVVQVAHAVDRATGGTTDLPSGDPLDAVTVVIEAMERRGLNGLVLDGVNARTHAEPWTCSDTCATACHGRPRSS